MYKMYFGKPRRMIFNSPEEYYETLGFIAKGDGSCDLYREDNQNQGAWNYEIRMNCYRNIGKFPLPLSRKFTAGRGGNVLHRINCNEFIEDLVANHAFIYGAIQNMPAIRATIPHANLVDFDRGFNL